MAASLQASKKLLIVRMMLCLPTALANLLSDSVLAVLSLRVHIMLQSRDLQQTADNIYQENQKRDIKNMLDKIKK